MKESTQILHQGDTPEKYHGAVNPPVVHASLFGYGTFEQFTHATGDAFHRPLYHRDFNPTVGVLEEKIAMLEHAQAAIAFASGMGAITAPLLALLSQGDHILLADTVYGPTREFCNTVLARLGVAVDYFPPAAAQNLADWVRPNTRIIFLESPGSLTFEVLNIQAVTALAQARGIITIFDNSWATPLFQKPLEMGVDIVVHSGTKYIAGHSDLTLGLLACSAAMFDRIKPVAAMLGASLAPDDAYLALRGLRTLPVRMAHMQDSALKIARWLQTRPEVARVLHPGLPNFAGHALARQQQTGYSSLFAFELQPGTAAARRAFTDALQLFLIAVSWGGYESLMLPLEIAFADEPAWRARRGLTADLFRTSIGLEDADDLMTDLERGLAAWRAALD